MDEFGVLTERFGLKPQGKSAPMAASRRPVNTNDGQSWNVGFDSDVNPNLSSFSDDRNGFYQSGKDTKTQNSGRLNDYDDIFGGPSKQSASHGGSSSFDIGSFLSGSNVNSSSSHAYDDDDIFGVRGLNSSTSANNAMNSDDIFGSFASPPNPSAPIDDLLADFVGADAKPKFSNRNTSGNAVNQASGFDDLIPGFGPSVPSNNGRNTNSQHPRHSTTSTFTSSEDPFAVLESTTTSTSKNAYASANLLDPLERISKPNNPGGIKPPRLKSPPKGTHISRGHKVKSSNMSSVKSSSVSSLDELEDFAMFKVQSNVNGRPIPHSSGEWLGTSANKASSHGGDDFSIFENGRSSSVPRSRTTTLDPMFDSQSKSRGVPEPGVPQRTTSRTSSVMKKSTSASGIFDDLSSMFGDVQILEEFQEVEGESEERRNARIERLQRTHDRMTKALADMNQRDFQSQQEQEERRRIAETLDAKIKRWAAGKEGNMRALLSSLQYVLWPECGWEPVSLTDIITSSSVKKVYRKATLYVHPDKVQQKGATLEQKYTAEKIFDLLKEAWNKFNKEELSKC